MRIDSHLLDKKTSSSSKFARSRAITCNLATVKKAGAKLANCIGDAPAACLRNGSSKQAILFLKIRLKIASSFMVTNVLVLKEAISLAV